MNDKPVEGHQFDTLRLLSELKETDGAADGTYSVDEILREFHEKQNGPDQTAPAAPSAETEREDSSIVDQIQRAIDREMELSQAAPEPVIHLDEEPEASEAAQKKETNPAFDGVRVKEQTARLQKTLQQPLQEQKQPEEEDLGDPELNALFGKRQPAVQPGMPRAAEPVQASAPKAAAQTPPSAQKEPPRQATPKQEAPLRRKRQRKQAQAKIRVVKEEKEPPVPDAAELFRKTTKAIRPARSRMTAVLLLSLLAIFWTACNQYGWLSSAVFSDNQIASKVLLGLMVLCALLALPVLLDGFRAICALRCNLNSLIFLVFLVSAVDAALCTKEKQVPFCAVVCVFFYFAAWGDMLKRISIRRALRPLQKLETPLGGVVTAQHVWEGASVITEGAGNAEQHVRSLLRENLTDRVMRIYAPLAGLISLALAFVVKFKTGNSLTWAWSSMMICALPLAGFLSFYRPFAILSGKLMKNGAALSGWEGARQLGTAKAVLVKDTDIFPAGQVTLGGMKVYGSYSVGQCVGYAASVIEVSGSGLIPLFQELRRSNNGRFFPVSQFRRYEGGGYGAEVAGDVVLLGSLRFMQLMGVYMHEGTRVRNAIYLSVNGEMCAVFAVNHAPSGKVRRALHEILDTARLTPLFATRDFLITPMMVEERYKVPNSRLEFPNAEQRDRLCQLPEGHPSVQGGILTKHAFESVGETVAGARLLRIVTKSSTLINLAGGILGICLMFLLTYLGAQSVVTACNILLYALVWTLPTLILTNWVGRY